MDLSANNLRNEIIRALQGERAYMMVGRKWCPPNTNSCFYPDLCIVDQSVSDPPASDDDSFEPQIVVEVYGSDQGVDVGRQLKLYQAVASVRQILLIHRDGFYVQSWVRSGSTWTRAEYLKLADNVPIPSLDIGVSMQHIYEGFAERLVQQAATMEQDPGAILQGLAWTALGASLWIIFVFISNELYENSERTWYRIAATILGAAIPLALAVPAVIFLRNKKVEFVLAAIGILFFVLNFALADLMFSKQASPNQSVLNACRTACWVMMFAMMLTVPQFIEFNKKKEARKIRSSSEESKQD